MIQPNPALQKLGLGPADRAVVVHADDIGMCQATMSAFEELVASWPVVSASTMVPCAWFPQLAAYCRAHPQVDVGVHLTLCSEWETYRWAPISTSERASGLIDQEGYFHRTAADLHKRAALPAVEAELQAQLDRALAAGIEVTHIDTHMFALLHWALIPLYVQLAARHRLPLMFIRADAQGWQKMGLDAESAAVAAQFTLELEAQGVPLFDQVVVAPLSHPEGRIELVKRLFDELPPGLSQLIFHPAHDTPELRAAAPDYACRVADHAALMSDELREYVRGAGFRVIGYRALYDAMNGS